MRFQSTVRQPIPSKNEATPTPQESVTLSSDLENVATVAMTTAAGALAGGAFAVLTGNGLNGAGILMGMVGGIAGAISGTIISGDF